MTAVVTRLAAVASTGVDARPEAVADYVEALLSGKDPTTLLWQDLVRSGRPVPAKWDALHFGWVDDQVALRHALLLLVAFDGWGRLKTCARTRCRRPFVDATNAATRTHCALHLRHRGRARR